MVGFWRHVMMVLAWVFTICIVVQTLLAGLALFADPIHWGKHSLFVKFFTYVPLLMLLFAIAGQLSRALRWQSAGLFAMIYAQYFTANLPGAGALHPVIALVLFWMAMRVALGATSACFGHRAASGEAVQAGKHD